MFRTGGELSEAEDGESTVGQHPFQRSTGHVGRSQRLCAIGGKELETHLLGGRFVGVVLQIEEIGFGSIFRHAEGCAVKGDVLPVPALQSGLGGGVVHEFRNPDETGLVLVRGCFELSAGTVAISSFKERLGRKGREEDVGIIAFRGDFFKFHLGADRGVAPFGYIASVRHEILTSRTDADCPGAGEVVTSVHSVEDFAESDDCGFPLFRGGLQTVVLAEIFSKEVLEIEVTQFIGFFQTPHVEVLLIVTDRGIQR